MIDLICGVDEAGRGPLVGSVVAAAVVLNPDNPIIGLKDSKKLSERQRNLLFDQIVNQSYCFHVASASHLEIDALNILQATMLAMSRAIEGVCHKLGKKPDITLIDGNRCPNIDIPMKSIIQGDNLVKEISAASILAKVTRDREMLRLHDEYPMYGFNRHMGYPTAMHLEALKLHGPCVFHRRSYRPVREALEGSNR